MKDYGVTVTGNLGRDPEARTTQGGKETVQVGVATYTGKDKPPTWVTVTDYGDERGLSKFRKGQKVRAWGYLRTSEYTTKAGDARLGLYLTVYELEAVTDDRKTGGGGGGASSELTDEDIPF